MYRIGLEVLRASRLHRLPGLADRGQGIVFTLHHVSSAPQPSFAPNRGLTVTPEFLDSAIRMVRAQGYDIVTLDEVERRLRGPAPGKRFAAFTLDDGYRDNRDVALPVFRRHAVPFTVFVPTGFVEHRVVIWWSVLEEILRTADAIRFDFGTGAQDIALPNDKARQRAWKRFKLWVTHADPALVLERIAELARNTGIDPLEATRREIMTVEELKAFAADPLVSIGGHTVTHPNLANLAPDAMRAEVLQGFETLAGWLGERPRHFAYPYGFPAAARRAQFDIARDLVPGLAFTTRPGLLHPAHAGHLTALPRVSLNGDFQRCDMLDVLMSGVPFFMRNGFQRLDVA